MAKSVKIYIKENTAKIIVDGNEIHDVVSYELSENTDGAFLTLKIAVGEVDAAVNPKENGVSVEEVVHQLQESFQGLISTTVTEKGEEAKL